MEEPFSRIPGIFPKTLSENQKEKYFKKPIDKSGKYAIIQKLSDTDMQNQILGGIAQLGERLNGIQEVSGSIPLISTRKQAKGRNPLVQNGLWPFCFSFLFS